MSKKANYQFISAYCCIRCRAEFIYCFDSREDENEKESCHFCYPDAPFRRPFPRRLDDEVHRTLRLLSEIRRAEANTRLVVEADFLPISELAELNSMISSKGGDA